MPFTICIVVEHPNELSGKKTETLCAFFRVYNKAIT